MAADVATLPVLAALPRRSVGLQGHEIPLHYGFRRWDWRLERCVEIGLAGRALAAHDPTEVLEVGNVLRLAGYSGHTVVDKYEAGEGVINEDIVDYAPGRQFALVLSISTLEHVGWDEIPREPGKGVRALTTMSELVVPGGALLITIPVGYNRELQEALVAPAAPFDSVTLFVKTGRAARWEPRPLSELPVQKYGSPYACGNAILVGIRGEPFEAR